MLIQKIPSINLASRPCNNRIKPIGFNGEWVTQSCGNAYPHEETSSTLHTYRPFSDETPEEIYRAVEAKFGPSMARSCEKLPPSGYSGHIAGISTQVVVGKTLNRELKNQEYSLMGEIKQSFADVANKYIKVAESILQQGELEDIKNAKGALESAKNVCNISCMDDKMKSSILNKIEGLLYKLPKTL